MFPNRRSLAEYQLLGKLKSGKLFGYVQCNIEVPNKLKPQFANFRPLFKNTLIDRKDFGKLMKQYSEEEGLMSESQKMLFSSFMLQNRTRNTPLLLFYLEMGLVCTKIRRFLEDTQENCFKKFVHSAVDARRQGDENPISSVVAETMKLLTDSSYGYHILDRSRQTVTKYLNDEKTLCAINSKFFKKLDHVNHQLYEVELEKAEVERKEPVVVGFFILQYAKLRLLELYYNFLDKFCDINKFGELEMDTDSFYLALTEQELTDCIRREMKAQWEKMRSTICDDSFVADASGNFFPRTFCAKHKKHDKREPCLFN